MDFANRLTALERRMAALEQWRHLPQVAMPRAPAGAVETVDVGGERVVTGRILAAGDDANQFSLPLQGTHCSCRRQELPYPPHHAGPAEEYGLEDDMRLRR